MPLCAVSLLPCSSEVRNGLYTTATAPQVRTDKLPARAVLWSCSATRATTLVMQTPALQVGSDCSGEQLRAPTHRLNGQLKGHQQALNNSRHRHGLLSCSRDPSHGQRHVHGPNRNEADAEGPATTAIRARDRSESAQWSRAPQLASHARHRTMDVPHVHGINYCAAPTHRPAPTRPAIAQSPVVLIKPSNVLHPEGNTPVSLAQARQQELLHQLQLLSDARRLSAKATHRQRHCERRCPCMHISRLLQSSFKARAIHWPWH